MSVASGVLEKQGDRYKEFLVTKSLPLEDINCVLWEFRHEPSGAEVVHLQNDDPENLFCLSLRTFPPTSNGVAHILEHTVLCGSEKFPVKDPFFSMNRRSLNTYMNALTSSDFTCYPAASQVPKDFYNLLEVYLDAVFKPNLKELSFLQEGHRLELPEGVEGPLSYGGIVFNEMKGALASPDARLWYALLAATFPGNTYGVNSGGEPAVIPDLTYQELLDFHKRYYHPSRAIFYFYGSLPVTDHLDFIDAKLLKDVQREEPVPPIPKQPRFKESSLVHDYYPLPPNEDATEKTMVGMGWLTCSVLEQEEILALNVIDLLLMGTDASPLKFALLESGLCKQVDSMIDDEVAEVPYYFIFHGCQPEDVSMIEEVMGEVLKKVVESEIPEELVDAAIHQLEFYRTEITGNRTPYGLSLFMRSVMLKQHGGAVEDGLQIHTLFNKLREDCKKPGYLTNLIRQYMVENPHFVRVTMEPDQKLGTEEMKQELQRLQVIKEGLSDAQKEEIIQRNEELKIFQEAQEQEDLEVLPKVTLADVPKKGREFPLHKEESGKGSVIHHDCFTNKIIYADLLFELPQLTEEELPYAGLFSSFMTEVGCGDRTYQENLEYMQRHTGDVDAYLAMHLQATDHQQIRPALAIRGKALSRKKDYLLPLMRDIVTSVNFNDPYRIKQLLTQHYSSMENNLPRTALQYAASLAGSHFSSPARVSSCWRGLDYYWAVKELVSDIDKNVDKVIETLNGLKERMLSGSNGQLVVTCDQADLEEAQRSYFWGLTELGEGKSSKFDLELPPLTTGSQGRIIASPVSFMATLFPTVEYVDPAAAALSTTAALLENTTLHRRIREQGGAYGGGAVNNLNSGFFYFYAYRDPNISSTLKAFDESVNNIIEGKFDARELEEAKLGVLQALDSPIAPGSRGATAYSWEQEGRGSEVREQFRKRLLAVDTNEVREVSKRILEPGLQQAVTVSFAGEELLEKENKLLEAMGKTLLQIKEV